MADDEETASSRSSSRLTKTRMEALSDGVLAIAMTLLVLDLALQPPGSPVEQFFREWPAYLAYLISFLTIGGAWIAHNALTDGLERVDRIFLRLNLLFLMLIAFLPFPTRLVGEALHEGTGAERLATVVYGISLLAIRLVFFGLTVYSRRMHLRRASSEDADMQEMGKEVLDRSPRLPCHDPAQPSRSRCSGGRLPGHCRIPVRPLPSRRSRASGRSRRLSQ